MIDHRVEPRKPESHLPPVFERLTVHAGTTTFSCKAVDAGAHGLGLRAEMANKSKISIGQKIKVSFETFTLDAEVLNIYEGFGEKHFRFGVFLFKENQLKPFWQLLEKAKSS